MSEEIKTTPETSSVSDTTDPEAKAKAEAEALREEMRKYVATLDPFNPEADAAARTIGADTLSKSSRLAQDDYNDPWVHDPEVARKARNDERQAAALKGFSTARHALSESVLSRPISINQQGQSIPYSDPNAPKRDREHLRAPE